MPLYHLRITTMNALATVYDNSVSKYMPRYVRHLFMMVSYFLTSNNFETLPLSKNEQALIAKLKQKNQVYKDMVQDLLHASAIGYDLPALAEQIRNYYSPAEIEDILNTYKELIGSK